VSPEFPPLNFPGSDRNAIAHAYDLDEVNLTSFLHHLSIVRNHCAHHARLWKRPCRSTGKFQPNGWETSLQYPGDAGISHGQHQPKYLETAVGQPFCQTSARAGAGHGFSG